MTAPLSGSLLAAAAWFAIAVVSLVPAGNASCIFLLGADSGARPGMKVK